MNQLPAVTDAPFACVNGVTIANSAETLNAQQLRQRACSELLRQAAINAGLLDADDPEPIDGAMSESASDAVEKLLDDELQTPEPDDEACQRFFAGNTARFNAGERVNARHILFAVTPGVDVKALRKRAEACLIDLRCQTEAGENRFGKVAGETSNCPSGADGGDLGWLLQSDCAPEFAQEIFAKPEVGILPRLVHSRFGLTSWKSLNGKWAHFRFTNRFTRTSCKHCSDNSSQPPFDNTCSYWRDKQTLKASIWTAAITRWCNNSAGIVNLIPPSNS